MTPRERLEFVIEAWEDLTRFPGYSVSNQGRVRSNARKSADGRNLRERIMRDFDTGDGHRQVSLRRNGKGVTVTVHSLVAEAFLPPKPTDGYYEIRHLNGIGTDNRAANLKWGTRSENQRDAVRHNTHVHAKKTHCPRNHEYSGFNLYISPNGTRHCKTCTAEWNRVKRRGGEFNESRADADYELRMSGAYEQDQEARLDRLRAMVEDNVSFSEIIRTLKMDYYTIKRHFPDYKPFPVGGGGEAQVIRQANQELRRIDNYGNLSTRREKR